MRSESFTKYYYYIDLNSLDKKITVVFSKELSGKEEYLLEQFLLTIERLIIKEDRYFDIKCSINTFIIQFLEELFSNDSGLISIECLDKQK